VRNASWVKSRIAARILLRGERGTISARDRRFARILAKDEAVTDRLLGQALSCIFAEKKIGLREQDEIRKRILEPVPSNHL
jgi:hypothetical protein